MLVEDIDSIFNAQNRPKQLNCIEGAGIGGGIVLCGPSCSPFRHYSPLQYRRSLALSFYSNHNFALPSLFAALFVQCRDFRTIPLEMPKLWDVSVILTPDRGTPKI
ncbi:hypothetical protein TNCV_2299821 [Trichonephila clavipes]|nr:hypothetical protein TNCV_2299821 [Trichonephila clavipes]